MSLSRYSSRELRRRPGRTVLTLLGIVIGVAAIVSIGLTLAQTRAAYRTLFETAGGRASLEVTTAGRGGFDPGVAEDLGAVPGVRSAVPVVSAYAALLTPKGVATVCVMGIDPAIDRAARDLDLVSGTSASTDGDMLVPVEFAAAQGLAEGASVSLLTASGPTGLRISGLVARTGAAGAFGGAVVFTSIPTAQRLFNLTSRINAVQLVLEDSTEVDAVRAAVAARLTAGLLVQPTAARSGILAQTNFSSELGLSALSVVSLVAGGFVILNACLMSLHERRRGFAILRALGATRSQITRMILRESMILGVVGTILGIAVGVAGAMLLSRMLESMLQVTRLKFQPTPWPFLLGAILGPGVTLAATIVPARQASRLPPLEGIFDARETRGARIHRWPGYLGVALLLLSGLLVGSLVAGWLPPNLARPLLPLGMALIAVGSALVVPLTVEPLCALLARPLRRLLGIEGTIALRQLARHPTRTHLTVSVLAVSMVVAVGFGNSIRNSSNDVRRWAELIGSVDFLVRASMPDPALIRAATLPDESVETLSRLDGVALASRGHFGFAEVAGRQVLIIARALPEGWPCQIDVVEGNADEVHTQMRRGEIVIATLLAQLTGKSVGDEIEIATINGPAAVRIAATSTEYNGGGLLAQLEWEAAQRLLGHREVHYVALAALPGQARRVEEQLSAYCREHDLQFETRNEFLAMVASSMSAVIGSLWALLALVFLVASLGIANTLTMNALEQTREIGLLRAVAMTRRQLFRTMIAQAAAMGLVSLPAGTLLGIVLAWMIVISTYPLSGFHVEFELEPWHVAGCMVIAMAIAILAAVIPARRAARLSVIRALQYE